MCAIGGLIVFFSTFCYDFFGHYWSPLLNCDRLSLPAYNCVTVTKIEKTQEYKAGPRRVERVQCANKKNT